MIFFTVASNSLFPKPVGIPAQTLIRNLMQITHAMYGPAEPEDRVLLPISVHHIFGTLSMYASLLGGASVHTMTKYSGRALASAIDTHRLTRVHLTTNMAQLLMADTEELGMLSGGALRCIIIGGARFDPTLARLYKENMPDVRIQQSSVLSQCLCCVRMSDCVLVKCMSPRRQEAAVP